MHPRNDSTNRFGLFEKFAGDYKNKKILDYGGNRGNLLYFSQGKIKEENYTSIDVEKDAIQQGKIEFNNANFIHYNRFSPMYNQGNINEPFPILENYYDICFAFSVFTHTDFYTFEETIYELKKVASKLIISFVDNNNISMKNWVYNKRCLDFGDCIALDTNSDYSYLLNNDILLKNKKICNQTCKYFFSFYNNTFLQQTFNCTIYLQQQGQDFLVIN